MPIWRAKCARLPSTARVADTKIQVPPRCSRCSAKRWATDSGVVRSWAWLSVVWAQRIRSSVDSVGSAGEAGVSSAAMPAKTEAAGSPARPPGSGPDAEEAGAFCGSGPAGGLSGWQARSKARCQWRSRPSSSSVRSCRWVRSAEAAATGRRASAWSSSTSSTSGSTSLSHSFTSWASAVWSSSSPRRSMPGGRASRSRPATCSS